MLPRRHPLMARSRSFPYIGEDGFNDIQQKDSAGLTLYMNEREKYE